MERLGVCFSLLSAVAWGWSSAKNCLSNWYSPWTPGTQSQALKGCLLGCQCKNWAPDIKEKKKTGTPDLCKSSSLGDTSTVEHSKEEYRDGICQL